MGRKKWPQIIININVGPKEGSMVSNTTPIIRNNGAEEEGPARPRQGGPGEDFPVIEGLHPTEGEQEGGSDE